MTDSLFDINPGELKLDPGVRDLLQRLLNHIEVLTKKNRELKEKISNCAMKMPTLKERKANRR